MLLFSFEEEEEKLSTTLGEFINDKLIRRARDIKNIFYYSTNASAVEINSYIKSVVNYPGNRALV